MDREAQYFLAEATKSLNLNDPSRYEAEHDALWAGCSSSVRTGKLCERTIALSPSEKPSYSFFVVNDLSKDDTFKKLPFVSGPPHFRYYAGTPLTTENRINIGSFFVLDVQPRAGLTDAEKDILGTLATLVMDYLRVSRQASEGRRATRLSRGLSCFVEGSSSFVDSVHPSEARNPIPLAPSRNAFQTRTPAASRGSSLEIRSGRSRSREAEHSGSGSDDKLETGTSSDVTTPLPEWFIPSHHYGKNDQGRPGDDAHGNLWAFRRAANLLRESLELGGDGGVIFLEASQSPGLDVDHGREDYFTEPTSPAPVLAVSTNDEPFSPEPGSKATCPAANFNRRFLQQILRRYPKGKLWSFHRDGSLFTSDDDDKPSPSSSVSFKASHKPRGSGTKWKATEASMLSTYFPNATQVLFVPLWNAANSQWFAGCFCWNAVETRVFSSAVELSSVLGFGSSIMAECSRVESLIADRQKGDFIGSISHELRSPLHGILAAAEFLDGTRMSEFQKSLLDTINSCGRTLLDTMNQVLDFTKIVSLERTWRQMKRRRDAPRDAKGGETVSAHLDTYIPTDVAVLAEEVIEGVCLGRSYSRASSYAAGDPPVTLPPRTDQSQPVLQLPDNNILPSGIEVVVDIAHRDWVFMTQPGALRRILLNIFGNAMKYTTQGRVFVRLESVQLPEDYNGRYAPGELVVLTVSDTGKGISEEFLRGRLYTPFAQEDTLAVGTGLGLSIVRSIVKTLDGNITIRSRPGQGTVVRVSLPLRRPAADDSPPAVSPTQLLQKDSSDRIRILRDNYSGKKVAILGFTPESDNDPDPWSAIVQYVTDWFGLEVVPWSPTTPIDLLLADEQDLVTIDMEKHPSACVPALLILCDTSVDYSKPATRWSSFASFIDFLHRPCGPHKLAKTILRCLGQSHLSLPSSQLSMDRVTNGPPTPDSSIDGQSKPGNLYTAPEESSLAVVQRPDAVTESSAIITAHTEHNSSLSSREGALGRKSAPTVLLAAQETPDPIPPICLENSNDDTRPKRRATRVLVVDDNKINLQLMLTFMKRRNLSVLDSAENGKIAVDAVERMQEGYDIIFMDMSMPVMNGFEATRAIRALEKERDGCGATIIALTGLTSARDESEALASGVDLFLTKPVSFKEVSRLLDEWEDKPPQQ